MRVGDLVEYTSVPHEFAEYHTELGIIIKMSRTGRKTQSAQVKFMNGSVAWHDTQVLRVINESR